MVVVHFHLVGGCFSTECLVATLLQRKSRFNIKQLQFRRNIAMHYCNTVAIRITNRPIAPYFNIPENDRFDNIDHYPAASTKRRCQSDNCNRRSSVKCEKCVVLCFKDFHIRRFWMIFYELSSSKRSKWSTFIFFYLFKSFSNYFWYIHSICSRIKHK